MVSRGGWDRSKMDRILAVFWPYSVDFWGFGPMGRTDAAPRNESWIGENTN